MASTLFTAGIIVGFIALFIFLFSLLHKRGKRKTLANQQAKFAQLVSTNNLTINEKEEFSYYLIAIDHSNAKLLYLNFHKLEEDATVIDLQKIKTTKIDIEENSVYEDRKGKPVLIEKHILKLQLELVPKDTSQPKLLLPFYQYQDGMVDLNRLRKRIGYWIDKTNNLLKDIIHQPFDKI